MFSLKLFAVLLVAFLFDHFTASSALRDGKSPALVARELVHRANWASVGTISTKPEILNYPMVNVISIDDNEDGKSTGRIRFFLTDMDFTGRDWRAMNKVTFLFSDEQNLACQSRQVDPMEPTCARAIISGEIKEMDISDSKYEVAMDAFKKRHPASNNWLRAHTFYLAELDIHNIYVMHTYGGPPSVTPKEYYDIVLDE